MPDQPRRRCCVQGKMCNSGPERCCWAHNTFEAYLHPAKWVSGKRAKWVSGPETHFFAAFLLVSFCS